jgi:hypothetical protein
VKDRSASATGHERGRDSGFPSVKALHMTLALPAKSGVMYCVPAALRVRLCHVNLPLVSKAANHVEIVPSVARNLDACCVDVPCTPRLRIFDVDAGVEN